MPNVPRTPHTGPKRAGSRPRQPLRLAIVAGAIGVLLAPWPGPASAQTAQPAAQAYDIDLPAQPLAQALAALSRQTGVQVFAAGELVSGRAAPAVRGRLGAQQALDRLLAGTGLVATTEGSAFTVKTAPPATSFVPVLPPVTVTGRAGPLPGDLPQTYAGGQVARDSRLGMLGNTDVFETPFATKAYTAELVLNQGARTINDVVANDPSIRTTFSATAPLDVSSVRGFQMNGDSYLFDGMSNMSDYSNAAVQNFERVEVIKGPSAALGGALGNVGGTISVVPKRATDAPVRSVTLSVSDKSLAGVHLDLGGRFGPENAFGARLNVSAEDGDFYNGNSRRMLAPQIALDFRGERLRVILDAGSTSYWSSPSFGSQFTLLPGASLPRVPDPRVSFLPAWDTLNYHSTIGLLTAEWDVTDQWTGYARYGRFSEEPSKRIDPNYTAVDSLGQYTITGRTSYLWRQDNDNTEVGLRGQVQWGGIRQQIAINAIYDRLNYHDERYLSEDVTPVVQSIYSQSTYPNPFAAGIPSVASVDYAPTYVSSFAIADTVSMLDDALKLTLSLRRQSIKNDPYDQSKTTPIVAALYKLGNGLSIYGNYAEGLNQGDIAQPPATNAGQQLLPYVSRQKEAGVKFDGGNYGLTAAVFEIRQAFAYLGSDNVYRAGGLQTNRGIELEAFGEPVKGFRPLGGVAWTDGKQSSTEGGATDGKKALGVPEFTANLGAEFDVPALQGLTLTGRVIHTGSAYADLTNTQLVPAWNRLDAGARYKTNWSGQALTVRLGVDNLMDKAYYTTSGRGIIAVAPPRTWRLSATVSF